MMHSLKYMFWLGSDAKAIADEYETQQQLAREAYVVDLTDSQAEYE